MQESAELIGSLPSAVQRDVYGGRVAEAAKISADAMQMEIKRAWSDGSIRKRESRRKLTCLPPGIYNPKAGTSAIPT